MRNHIKIEQQLKLHIECLQDKYDECEKGRGKERQEAEESVEKGKKLGEKVAEMEKELEKLHTVNNKLNRDTSEMKAKIDLLEKDLRASRAQKD